MLFWVALQKAFRGADGRRVAALIGVFVVLPAAYYVARAVVEGKIVGAVIFAALLVAALLLVRWTLAD